MGLIYDWNMRRSPEYRIYKCEDITVEKPGHLSQQLQQAYSWVEAGLYDIISVTLPQDFVQSSSCSQESFAAVQNSLSLRPKSFCELRTASKSENTSWHVHLISSKEYDREKRKLLTYGKIGWNTTAFTLNMGVRGPTTEFTSPQNIMYDFIDCDFDLEEKPDDFSLGNLVGCDTLHEEHVFIPPEGTIMIFRDNVVHRAPSIEAQREYVIAGNVPFDVEYDPNNPHHARIPTEVLDRCRLFAKYGLVNSQELIDQLPG